MTEQERLTESFKQVHGREPAEGDMWGDEICGQQIRCWHDGAWCNLSTMRPLVEENPNDSVLRMLNITIRAGDEVCGACKLIGEDREGEWCPLFKTVLRMKDGQNKRGQNLRCQECLDREDGRLD